jgi:hypothetical protein
MVKNITFPPWLTRQNLLVGAMLSLTISPMLSMAGFVGAALVTVFGEAEGAWTRERKGLVILLFALSLGFAWHNTQPEAIGPGRVAFTDYVPPLWFFFCLSWKPFPTAEVRKILYAFLFTVPQQFFLALGEIFLHWRGRFYFPLRKLPLLDLYWGPSEKGLKVSASFFNPNILALYALMGVIFSLSLYFQEKDKEFVPSRLGKARYFFLWTVFFFSALLLFWTGSRYAWFFLLAAVFFFGRMSTHWLLKLIGAVMLLATLLALTHLFFPLPWLQAILPSVLTSKLTVFSEDRGLYYQWAWELIRTKPLWGWGIGTFPQLVAGRVRYTVLHAHSLPLQLGVEVGIPLAVSFLAFLIGLILLLGFRLSRKEKEEKHPDHLQRGLWAAAGIIFLMQIFDLALLMTYRLHFLFWLCLAIPFSQRVPSAARGTKEVQ